MKPLADGVCSWPPPIVVKSMLLSLPTSDLFISIDNDSPLILLAASPTSKERDNNNVELSIIFNELPVNFLYYKIK